MSSRRTTAGSKRPAAPASPWSSLGPSRYVVLALALVASATLVLGLTLPVVYIRRGLTNDTYSVLTGIVDLAKGDNVLLALIVFFFSVVFPITKLAVLLGTLFLRLSEDRRTNALRSLTLLGRWSMLDVFVIAILVGTIQLGLLSEAQPRPGIYVFAGAILLSMIGTMVMEFLVVRQEEASGILETSDKLGRWTSIVACTLFLTGLSLPLMTVEKWAFWDNEYSVLRGMWSLAHEGALILAITLLVFVVALPLARFVGLAWLRWGERSERAARTVLLIDKWAMLDVFGLALLIVIVKIGDMATADPRPGFWILLVAVSLSLYDSWNLQRRAKG